MILNNFQNDLLCTVQATVAELVRVYHIVRHHISYNAADCSAKLDHLIYPDSAVVKKTACRGIGN
jgi:hypothetical protein